jgi:hypothetical protein
MPAANQRELIAELIAELITLLLTWNYCWRFFSSAFTFLSAFFSFIVLAGSFLVVFFASWLLLMALLQRVVIYRKYRGYFPGAYSTNEVYPE